MAKLRTKSASVSNAEGFVYVRKVVSGGQTGVDRAALDVALEGGIPCGGWCPKGRWAEDAPIADRYPLKETPLADVAQRTEWNARDSDGTLVLAEGEPVGGTALTIELARRYSKPCLVVDLTRKQDPNAIADWVSGNHIRVLNVAGPRESATPGIYAKAKALLQKKLRKS